MKSSSRGTTQPFWKEGGNRHGPISSIYRSMAIDTACAPVWPSGKALGW